MDAILPDLAGIITNPSTDPDLRDLTYRFVQWMALHLSLLSLLQRAHDTATASVDDFHREFRYGLQLISKALNLDYGLSLDD